MELKSVMGGLYSRLYNLLKSIVLKKGSLLISFLSFAPNLFVGSLSSNFY